MTRAGGHGLGLLIQRSLPRLRASLGTHPGGGLADGHAPAVARDVFQAVLACLSATVRPSRIA
jgi:hypothetical protein